MTSRELTKRTLEFDSPARVPRNLWVAPWAELNYPNEVQWLQTDFPGDTGGAPAPYPLVSQVVADAYDAHGAAYRIGSFTDEWNCTFEVRQNGTWGEVKNPVVKDWNDADKVRIPEEYLRIDTEKINACCRASDKFMIGPSMMADQARPFERYQFIRGSENTYVDLMEQRPEFHDLLGRIHQFYVKAIEQWAKTV